MRPEIRPVLASTSVRFTSSSVKKYSDFLLSDFWYPENASPAPKKECCFFLLSYEVSLMSVTLGFAGPSLEDL